MELARQRKDKCVQWITPDAPVFCAHAGDSTLQYGVPFPAASINYWLRRAADLAGILDNVTSHDLRRGAAHDMANLSQFNGEKQSSNDISVHLGHGQRSRTTGVTKAYIAKADEDVWTKRLGERDLLEEVSEHPLTIQDEGLKARSHIPSAEISDMCLQMGLSLRSRVDRERASNKIREQDRDAWKTSYNPNIAEAPSDATDVMQPVKRRRLIPQTTTQMNIGAGRLTKLSSSSFAHDDEPIIPVQLKSYDTDSPINPRFTNDLLGPTKLHPLDEEFGFGDADLNTSTVLQALDIETLAKAYDPIMDFDSASQPVIQSPELATKDWKAFVEFFSRINIFNIHQSQATQTGLKRTISGSKAPPQKMMFECPFTSRGCEKTLADRRSFERHAMGCRFKPADAQETAEPEVFICTEENCTTRFPTEKQLKEHVRNHKKAKTYKPKKCPQKGCECEEFFTSRAALDKHMYANHEEFKKKKQLCNQNYQAKISKARE